ncbi:MAG: hypothetical protein HY664_04040 [Chloroflexi bacterium]|nr:hypothetical protein [Chloroflexota bacterium]
MEGLTPLGLILALAFLAESLTEYLFADLLVSIKVDTKYLKYVAALVGVALALAYGLDAIQEFFAVSPGLPHLGQVLTGLILGRGANYTHDFIVNT